METPRGKLLAKRGLELPELTWQWQAIEYAFDVGDAECKWSDLKAWSEMTGNPLKEYEATAVMSFLRCYMAGTQEYSNSDKSAPWKAE